jgi:hypothetical protein
MNFTLHHRFPHGAQHAAASTRRGVRVPPTPDPSGNPIEAGLRAALVLRAESAASRIQLRIGGMR